MGGGGTTPERQINPGLRIIRGRGVPMQNFVSNSNEDFHRLVAKFDDFFSGVPRKRNVGSLKEWGVVVICNAMTRESSWTAAGR